MTVHVGAGRPPADPEVDEGQLEQDDHGPFGHFDDVVDRALGKFRGRPAVDAVAVVVSNLADYGFVWAVAAAAKGFRRGPARRRAIRALAVAGASSASVNALLKRAVQRDRPEVATRTRRADPLPVRTPTTSSFPSGHTLAAFCTAVVLADTPGEAALFVAFTAAVALSRVHLQAHHATDVVGGALVGTVVGAAARMTLPPG